MTLSTATSEEVPMPSTTTSERQIGALVKEVLCSDLERAQTLAGAEAANTSGHSIPVVIFQQGSRYNMSGALSFGFVASRLEVRSATARGSISDVNVAINRPEVPEHSDAIAKYIRDNLGGTYVLPPITLNIQQPVRLYSVDYNAQVRPGYLVIPALGKFAITDGQHRRSGIIRALVEYCKDNQDTLANDGIAVMITCESDINQIHQDFADCSKTKALAPSQVAVYDRRNPANRLVVDVEKACPIFTGKVDATSVKLGKRSTALFTANQVRQFVKVMLVGVWAMTDTDFEKRARERLDTDENYAMYLGRIAKYLNAVVDACPVLHELAQITGVDRNKIPVRRSEGWLVLTATGLVVLGLIGHEIMMAKNPEDWQDYARRLGAIDWLRSAPHWQGILVNNGKMITTQPATKAAVIKVRELIGWSPDLGVPDASLLSDLDLLGSGEETGSGSAGVEPAVSA
jgi:DNA sulfur modification protein DndB